MESKLNNLQAAKVVRRLGFDEFWAIDKQGRSRGLILMWKETITVKIYSSPGHILATIAGNGFLSWTFTGFYVNPNQSLRDDSWKLFRRIKDSVVGAWLFIGAFNEIIDFGNVKGKLTWSNGHEKGTVMERLDRGLCNKDWNLSFPKASIKVLDWCSSDHRAPVVDCGVVIKDNKCGKIKRNLRFHFEEAWCDDDECKDIVTTSWNSILSDGSTENLKVKLKLNDPEMWQDIKREEKRLNCLMEKDKKYWKKRSRAD
ncbi:hypothetical protein CsatA_019723 [Cannabis sativa]